MTELDLPKVAMRTYLLLGVVSFSTGMYQKKAAESRWDSTGLHRFRQTDCSGDHLAPPTCPPLVQGWSCDWVGIANSMSLTSRGALPVSTHPSPPSHSSPPRLGSLGPQQEADVGAKQPPTRKRWQKQLAHFKLDLTQKEAQQKHLTEDYEHWLARPGIGACRLIPLERGPPALRHQPSHKDPHQEAEADLKSEFLPASDLQKKTPKGGDSLQQRPLHVSGPGAVVIVKLLVTFYRCTIEMVHGPPVGDHWTSLSFISVLCSLADSRSTADGCVLLTGAAVEASTFVLLPERGSLSSIVHLSYLLCAYARLEQAPAIPPPHSSLTPKAAASPVAGKCPDGPGSISVLQNWPRFLYNLLIVRVCPQLRWHLVGHHTVALRSKANRDPLPVQTRSSVVAPSSIEEAVQGCHPKAAPSGAHGDLRLPRVGDGVTFRHSCREGEGEREGGRGRKRERGGEGEKEREREGERGRRREGERVEGEKEEGERDRRKEGERVGREWGEKEKEGAREGRGKEREGRREKEWTERWREGEKVGGIEGGREREWGEKERRREGGREKEWREGERERGREGEEGGREGNGEREEGRERERSIFFLKRTRMEKAGTAFFKTKKVFCSHDLSLKTENQACLRRGEELVWDRRPLEETREAFEMWIYRRLNEQPPGKAKGNHQNHQKRRKLEYFRHGMQHLEKYGIRLLIPQAEEGHCGFKIEGTGLDKTQRPFFHAAVDKNRMANKKKKNENLDAGDVFLQKNRKGPGKPRPTLGGISTRFSWLPFGLAWFWLLLRLTFQFISCWLALLSASASEISRRGWASSGEGEVHPFHSSSKDWWNSLPQGLLSAPG
ncbi:hypothetical protein L345_12944, partial [Ophiophagus hannah]